MLRQWRLIAGRCWCRLNRSVFLSDAVVPVHFLRFMEEEVQRCAKKLGCEWCYALVATLSNFVSECWIQVSMSTHCSKPTGLEIDAPSLQPKLGPPWQSRQQGSQTGTKLISESQEALLRGSTFRVQLHAISESAFFNGISGALQTYQALIHIHPPHCGKVGDPPKAFCKMFFNGLPVTILDTVHLDTLFFQRVGHCLSMSIH